MAPPTELVFVRFEIDPETNEATGIIYWFCSTTCRDTNTDGPSQPWATLKDGDGVELGDDELVCETCGRWLDPDTATAYGSPSPWE